VKGGNTSTQFNGMRPAGFLRSILHAGNHGVGSRIGTSRANRCLKLKAQ
jgi:hypothetical protein